jgi:hypothetical protein
MKNPRPGSYADQGTQTKAGLLKTATEAELNAGTSTELAVSPANLAGEGRLQFADVVLTSTQVKALRATPITLVAAQGAGKFIKLEGAVLKLNYGGSNGFTETADNLAIRLTDGSGAIVSQAIESTGFIDQTADTISNAEPKIDAIVASASAENEALVLHNTGDGEIAGNAADDNTLSVRVYYTVNAL